MPLQRQHISTEKAFFYKGKSRSKNEWETFAAELLGKEHVFLAYDIAKVGLEQFPESIKLRQIMAQALNRSGSHDEARAILEPLCGISMERNVKIREIYAGLQRVALGSEEPNSDQMDGLVALIAEIKDLDSSPSRLGPPDDESIGLLASVYKNIWIQTGEDRYGEMSRATYLRGFRETRSYWLGINFATLSRLNGKEDTAKQYAKQVLEICEKKLRLPDGEDLFWLYATIGEAHLLRGKGKMATKAYRTALEGSRPDYSRKGSALRQLKLLKSRGVPVPDELFDLLKPPVVVVFAGHMVDHPDRPLPRFTTDIEPHVKEKIEAELQKLDAKVGYCQAACGSDILFIEAMLQRNAEVNIVMPFDENDFVETSVRFAGERWVTRFRNALRLANTVSYVTEEKHLGDDVLFEFAGRIFNGYAYIRSHLLDTRPHLLAVLDGQSEARVGGTLAITDRWENGADRTVIDLKKLREEAEPRKSRRAKPKAVRDPTASHNPLTGQESTFRRTIKVMLFADMVGYSRLQEDQMDYFLNRFLPAIAEELSKAGRPSVVNTWGDAIFVAMNSAEKMLDYAFILAQSIAEINHRQPLPREPIAMRIALHAGPVFEKLDPITNRPNLYGAHVNRVARIEPIAASGHIYASEQFVAMLIEETSCKSGTFSMNRLPFNLTYIGTVPLAKGYGAQAVYLLKEKQRTQLGKCPMTPLS